MSEEKRPQEENQPEFVPASPLKRTMAWIGLVYALLLLAMVTYIFYTGKTLGNLGTLLTVPGLIGLGIVSIVSWRTQGKPSKWVAILAALALWVLAAFTLPIGLAGLMSNFGG